MTYYWPGEKKARVAALLKEGKTAREIGEALGCTKNSIIGIVRRNKDLTAIGYASRPGGQVRPPRDEKQAYNREYMRAWKARQKGNIIQFPVRTRKTAQSPSTPKPALRVVSSNVPMMVQDWLEKNGGPRRFERGATADILAVQIYLEQRGIRINGFRGRWTISTGRGRPSVIKWPEVIEMADQMRMEEGLEPFLLSSKYARGAFDGQSAGIFGG